MAFFYSLFWGGVFGTTFWAILDYNHPHILSRHIGRPIQYELSKDEVDVTKVVGLLFDGSANAIREISRKYS